MTDRAALELKARLALLAAPLNTLAEGALSKALGKLSTAVRSDLLLSLEAKGVLTLVPARRGRRVQLSPGHAERLAELRVSPRSRFSGAVVNALLAQLAGSAGEPTRFAEPIRERVLVAHDRIARGPGGTVELVALREALPDVDRRELEKTLLDLDRAGVLALGRPVDLATLDERSRSAAIQDPVRGPLVYVSRSAQSPVESRP